MPSIKIGGMNKGDFTQDSFFDVPPSTLEEYAITLAIVGVMPEWRKRGEDKKRIGGQPHACRIRDLFLTVKFAPFTVLANSSDNYNDHSDKMNLYKYILQKDFVYILDIDHERATFPAGGNLFGSEIDPEFPYSEQIKDYTIELIDENISPNFDKGYEEIEMTFQLIQKF